MCVFSISIIKSKLVYSNVEQKGSRSKEKRWKFNSIFVHVNESWSPEKQSKVPIVQSFRTNMKKDIDAARIFLIFICQTKPHYTSTISRIIRIKNKTELLLVVFYVAETTDDWFHFHFNYFIEKLNIRIFLVTPWMDRISILLSRGINQQKI